ncbi:hypothetical protein SM122_10775 [Streptococcus sp. S2(2023)]|uniref:DUF7448 domain-containing protein n=1 Tax=Streptococcus gingivalis TaxID=3111861 RepID=A0ABU6BAZ0_9STRE|nr:hypothetical protein [Streptococcus sp. S2(2023)]MEB3521030.1 hypothetical protein [Streptococcus sp. S2(2023)]
MNKDKVYLKGYVIGRAADTLGYQGLMVQLENLDIVETVTIYHNQNPIALAECEADDGNGGFYYSVGSLVIGNIHFPVVDA